MTFDRGEWPDFEELMTKGVGEHQAGRYEAALEPRLEAYAHAEPGSIEAGRAARDLAATFDRLGPDKPHGGCQSNRIMAAAYAEHAYRIHRRLAGNTNVETDPQAVHELTPSALYMAIVAARQALHRGVRRQFQDPSDPSLSKQNLRQEALRFAREARQLGSNLFGINGRWHQYDLNVSGRIAGLEGLWGDATQGLMLAIEAQRLALLSETPALLGATEQTTPEVEARAQRKAMVRAKAAMAVARMGLGPLKILSRPIANQLVDRVVL